MAATKANREPQKGGMDGRWMHHTDMQENTWARLRESRTHARARVTQPSPCIFLHISVQDFPHPTSKHIGYLMPPQYLVPLFPRKKNVSV